MSKDPSVGNGSPPAAIPSRRVILELEGISKAFPGVQALRDVRFELREGEVHVLLGENGAGKSTLMKIVTGALPKDAGEIRLDGRKVEIRNPQQALALGISMVYQEFNLAPHLSVAENIWLGREPLRDRWLGLVDRRRMREEASAILRRLHLPVHPDTPVSHLTVSQAQLVEIAKSLSARARILILDEPTAALTEAEIDELFRIIRELKAEGVSFVYISHRLEEIPRIGDRVTVLRDGEYVATVPATTDPAELIRLMVGRKLDQFYPKVPSRPGPVRLEVEGLCRSGVLHDVHLQIRAGEVVGLAGLIGAGRTELARAIFGADPVDHMRVRVDGAEVAIRSPADAIRAGIAYLSEDRKSLSLALTRSVAENISLASLDRFCTGPFVRAEAERRAVQEFVERLRIRTPSLNQQVQYLSGGNQQKVVLARWLLREAKVLLFDEPTRGVDVGAKAEIFELIGRLAQKGAAILLISSYLPELLGVCDRILVMHRGRIVGELSRAEATQEKILTLAALGSASAG
ncbi:MAG: sugar ABC transporter ATP-binding protein [candidate division KSB1 bacterium]|nr:sugar ABC transporter ATP-binding protein [candidate division KSB1 bacterium]